MTHEKKFDADGHAARLVELISAASKQRLRPFRTWARLIDAAVGGEEPLAVAADDVDVWEGDRVHVSGSLLVVTASFVARVRFEAATYAAAGMRADDGPLVIAVRARRTVRAMNLHVPGISRRERWSDADETAREDLPWGSRLEVLLHGEDEPLNVSQEWCTLPLPELHKLLLDDVRGAHLRTTPNEPGGAR